MLFNLAAFRSDYENIQIRFRNPDPLGVADLFRTLNGGDAIITGIETQLEIVPVTGLTASFGAVYLDQDATIANPFTGVTSKGQLPNVPSWKVDASLDYMFAPFAFGTLAIRAGYNFHDRQLPAGSTGGVPDYRPAYELFDARISLSEIPVAAGDLSVSLWGKNLKDAEYQVYHGAGAVMFGQPRSYGLNVLYKY
jgi:iron complex outermembrane receptor protein